MKLGKLLVILVVVYVGWKYVWPAVSAGKTKAPGSKAPAGRQMG